MEIEIITQILKSYGSVGLICVVAYFIISKIADKFFDLLDKKNNQITKLAEGQVAIMKEIADNMIIEIQTGRERADKRHEDTLTSQKNLENKLDIIILSKK